MYAPVCTYWGGGHIFGWNIFYFIIIIIDKSISVAYDRAAACRSTERKKGKNRRRTATAVYTNDYSL